MPKETLEKYPFWTVWIVNIFNKQFRIELEISHSFPVTNIKELATYLMPFAVFFYVHLAFFVYFF